jgi:hypothetical protein
MQGRGDRNPGFRISADAILHIRMLPFGARLRYNIRAQTALRAVEKGRTKPISAVHAFFVVCKFSTRFACRQVCKYERSGFVRAFSQEVAKVYLPIFVSTLNCNICAEFFSGAPPSTNLQLTRFTTRIKARPCCEAR